MPNALVTILERVKARRPFGIHPKDLDTVFLSDQVIETRIGLVLQGLKKGR